MADAHILNEHSKDEFPPAHTAEHLLNRVMVNKYGCERAHISHIERRKCKLTWTVKACPSQEDIEEIVSMMKHLIASDLPVHYEFGTRENLPAGVTLNRLPEDASACLRFVRIGDYDICPCIGSHVEHTAQIGEFVLLGTDWDEETHAFRIKFRAVPPASVQTE